MPRVAALLLLFLLAGCGPRLVQTDVTRFSTLPPGGGAAMSFTVLPDEPQRGSLEFERYAQLVAAQLESRGWRPVPASQRADVVVLLHWGIGEPRTESWWSPSSVYTGYGWGRSGWYGGGAFDPFPYREQRSITYFPAWLAVDIVDGPAWRDGVRRKLFEGRVVSDRTQAAIAPVMPYLVRALFTNFPGASGTTVRVAVPISE